MARFDYALPPEQIAQEPAPVRDASRALFAVRGRDGSELGRFRELPQRLADDACLVVNDTRVIPARLRARRATGAAIEVFLLRPEDEVTWQAWLQPARRVRPPERLQVGDEAVEVLERCGTFFRVRLSRPGLPHERGEVPLPPYIRRSTGDARLAALDAERYQTVFARRPGAVAAPTAGLHFTPGILEALRARGIPVLPITLHVGPGTFQPVTTATFGEHRVASELYEVGATTRAGLAAARRDGRRIIAVGTTALRVLETLPTLDDGPDLQGATDLTVGPGHRFRHVEGLVTNFHLPRSSLLVLVAAFHGVERTLTAYRTAVQAGLRFYSYGDAMVILPAPPC